ncbi:MAG: sulfite exporter TauE/SafE family protein [Parcubacteria group bacterium]|nr:sulfite exporter TauE/SafE family protein [Parcubacteria group bacterium]
MSYQQSRKIKLKIRGMHCASCEVLIERKFRKIGGVEKVHVNHANGKADIISREEVPLSVFEEAILGDGYHVSLWSDTAKPYLDQSSNTQKDYMQMGIIFLGVVGVYFVLKQFNILPRLSISDGMSYGFVFLIGLVAAMSTCLAVTGGLLLATAAKYNERFPDLSGLEKLKPTLYFNAGRVVSYTILGGVVGALGSVLTFSQRATGTITIVASFVMIVLGFQLLKLFPWMKRFQVKMPKFLAHKIHAVSSEALAKEDFGVRDCTLGSFLLGGSTFFLPCGFTQALQLYVLSKGDVWVGAFTMFAFSLGTLPALISLSAISSFVKGSFQTYFLKFAGIVVVVLGVVSMNSGFALTGLNIDMRPIFNGINSGRVVTTIGDQVAPIVNGKQIIEMRVRGLRYTPYQFTVVQGIPIEWRVDGSLAEGCAQIISIPKLRKTEFLLADRPTIITFTPNEIGTLPFNCPMGMTTRGAAFRVIPNIPVCDPKIANCVVSKKSK